MQSLFPWKDHLISVVAIVAYATALFWVGLMLILVFSIWFDWFPTSGMENVVMFYEGWERVVSSCRRSRSSATACAVVCCVTSTAMVLST